MDSDKELKVTIALGNGWKFTVLRRHRMGDTLQAWCGLARTEANWVTIYGNDELADVCDELPADSARAEVIFEPTYVLENGRWRVEEPGRTFYVGCPGSGRDGSNEQDLLKTISMEDLLKNILVLALRA